VARRVKALLAQFAFAPAPVYARVAAAGLSLLERYVAAAAAALAERQAWVAVLDLPPQQQLAGHKRGREGAEEQHASDSGAQQAPAAQAHVQAQPQAQAQALPLPPLFL
jgi:hypothetical protein